MDLTTKESARAEATEGQIAAAVMAYIQAGKRGLDLYGAMQCAIEAAICRTPSVTRGDYAELRRLAVAARSCATPYDIAWRQMSGALDPATVLAMIDRLEELEGAIK